MTESLLITVIIPCYNGSYFISDAIESVLAQSHANWELIIIDDASTDDSTNVIKKYCGDKRISILKNKKNLGIAKTKNKGILKSKGEFLAFLDQDDIWEKDKLTLQAARLKQDPEAGVVCCAMAFTNIALKKTTVFTGFDDIDQKELIKNLYITPVNSSSVMMIRKTCLDKIGVFDESLKGWDDYELLMRISKSHKIRYEREILVSKRIHQGGAQHRPEVIAEEDRVFENILKMHPFLAAYKGMHDSKCFFNRSITYILFGDQTAARYFAKKALAINFLSLTILTLYISTLLPPIFARVIVKIIFTITGRAKLISQQRLTTENRRYYA